MFYSVASPDWKPGQPLTPSGAVLFRTRSEAELFAPGTLAVAVAVRFDPRRCEVRPQGPVANAKAGPWAAPAVDNSLGGVSVFGAIPAALVRPSVEVEALADWRPIDDEPAACPCPSKTVAGWDSLAMALHA